MLTARNIRDQLLSEVAKIRNGYDSKGGRKEKENENGREREVKSDDRNREKDKGKGEKKSRWEGGSGRERGRERDRDTDREGRCDREVDRNRNRDEDSNRAREREREKERERETETEKDRGKDGGKDRSSNKGGNRSSQNLNQNHGRSQVEVDRRVCTAIAAGYFANAARRSANSDSIFYSLPLLENGSASNIRDGVYNYDSNEKLVLHLHSSSVLTHCTSQACYSAGCWPKQPEYVIYQVRLYTSCPVLF